MEEQIQSKKCGPMTPAEREKFNELENRVIKIETVFRTVGQVIKWTAVIIGIISAIVGLVIKLWPSFVG